MRGSSAVRLLLGATVAVFTLAGCANDKPAEKPQTFEAPLHALARLAPETATAMPADAAEAAGYTVAFRRFSTKTAPQDLTRTVVRPFGERTIEGGTRSVAFINDSPGSPRRVIPVRPGPNDPRPRVFAPDASFAAGGVRTVAGTTCRSYRKAEREYCIDNRGVVLITADAESADIATKVDYIDAAPEAGAYTQQLAPGFTDPNLGSIRPIADDSSPPGATEFALAAAPAGFTHVGRYAVVPLTGELLSQTSQEVSAGIVDVYVRGLDTIVVDRGGRLDRQAVTEKDLGSLVDGQPVDLGTLGQGTVGIAGGGPFGYREVRFFPTTGRYVVVAGTVPVDQLVAITKSLRASPGTDLHYLDSLG